MEIQEASSSCTPTSSFWWKYDVFLSFRGEDVRKNFISHLYNALSTAGINVFMDDKALERGNDIRPGLLQAIQESRFFVVVFSKNYASSTWCLDELGKIVECVNTRRQKVIPVFYDVDPSVVRKQIGEYEDVFVRHERTFKEKKNIVQMWREALKKVADIVGYDLKNRSESEVTKEIVNEISTELGNLTPMDPINLVGLESRVEELKRLIGEGSDVRMIGICGMGGIGKTTIAKVIYNLIKKDFECSSFLENIGENKENDKKIISLQEKLIDDTMRRKNIKILDVRNGVNEIRRLHNKKVLLVLDDVTDAKQLMFLVGEHNWFGPGSRIIITSRSKNLLCRVDHRYEAKLLNDGDSLQLFSWNAFRKYQPSEGYEELSKEVVQYSGGLPLALEVIGSSLYGITARDVWKSAIKRLSKEPNDEIINKLRIGFDGLSASEKEIFLDIACFFKGKSCAYVTNILEACDLDPIIGIDILVEKHLLNKVHLDTLWMHDLLQEMGRKIVKESSNEPGERSRVWEKEAARHLLKENTATKAIQGIMVEEDLNFQVGAEVFSKMINLRFLKIKNLQLPCGLTRLSNNLTLLEWHGYPLESLPSNFEVDKLVEIKLHDSNIKLLWNGIKQLSKLRYISLKNCQQLKEIPDLAYAPNLRDLFIEGCPTLCKILPPLQSFVPIKHLESLKLINCEKLIKIPDLVTCLPKLRELYIEGCPRLASIHPSFLVHENLVDIRIVNCTKLKTLPSKIHIKSLRHFGIHRCPELKKFPEIVGSMDNLISLTIDGTAINDMRFSYEFLPRLQYLDLTNNNELVTLSGLTSFEIKDSPKLENVEETLGQVEKLYQQEPISSGFPMKNLEYLSFRGCKGSQSKSYFYRWIPGRRTDLMALKLLSLSGLSCFLKRLDLGDCDLKEQDIPSDFFASLISLEELNLRSNNFVSPPTTINCLSKLKRLHLDGCRRLRSLTELPPNTCKVSLNGCDSLETLSDAFQLLNLENLTIECINCIKLVGGKNLMFSMLKDYLKVPNARSSFRMVMPAGEIPKWVMHQSESCSITMHRPPDLDNNRLMGLVACCVFFFREHLADLDTNNYASFNLYCSVTVDGDSRKIPWGEIITREEYLDSAPVSEHLWLLYDVIDYFDVIKYKALGTVSFYSYEGFEVKMCGVHPIYEQDLKHFNPATDRSSSSSLEYFNEPLGLKSLLDYENLKVITSHLRD